MNDIGEKIENIAVTSKGRSNNATIDLMNQNLTSVETVRLGHPSQGGSSGVIQLIWFDYHSKCARGDISRLGELVALLDSFVEGPGSSLRIDAHGKLLSKQRKVVRTNCIDCLDRTNVVQSFLARRALACQLKQLVGENFYENPSPGLEDYPKFLSEFSQAALEKAFRELWGDNGDNMSLLYAGTMALKRDVTRMGKRTRQGVLDDGMISAKRYFINNFKDPRYQRALDLILGKKKIV